jgi:hypothetical protein
MPDTPDRESKFSQRLEQDVRERMRALEGAVQEYARLKAILDIVEGGSQPTPIRVDAHGHGPPPRREPERRRGRPRGRRAAEVGELLQSEPGLTRAQLAERLGIRVGYLYELLPSLCKKGYVLERDGSWFAS